MCCVRPHWRPLPRWRWWWVPTAPSTRTPSRLTGTHCPLVRSAINRFAAHLLTSSLAHNFLPCRLRTCHHAGTIFPCLLHPRDLCCYFRGIRACQVSTLLTTSNKSELFTNSLHVDMLTCWCFNQGEIWNCLGVSLRPFLGFHCCARIGTECARSIR